MKLIYLITLALTWLLYAHTPAHAQMGTEAEWATQAEESPSRATQYIAISALALLTAGFIYYTRRRFFTAEGFSGDMLFIQASHPDKAPKRWAIKIPAQNRSSSWSIGRSSQCAINIKDGHASKLHAKIYYHHGHFSIMDKHSQNGIYLLNQKLLDSKHHDIKYDTPYKIGQTSLIFSLKARKTK